MKFSKGDLVENGCFQSVQLANVGGFSDFSMGRQLGGDASENGDFQMRKQRLQGVQFFFRSFHFIFRKKYTAGGDASENGDFQSGKQRLQGPIFSGALILYFKF